MRLRTTPSALLAILILQRVGVAALLSRDDEDLGKPGLETFVRVFQALAADPDFHREPERSDIRMVIGIMDVVADLRIPAGGRRDSVGERRLMRMAHRQSWMSLNAVCRADYETPTQPECSVFPVFVMGNGAMTTEYNCNQKNARELHRYPPNNCSQRYKTKLYEARNASGAFAKLHAEADERQDLVFLHGEPENMELGKTYAWFEFAVRAYPWATHIAKMDVDAYPFLHPLLGAIPVRHVYAKGPGCKLEDPSQAARFQYLGNMFKNKRDTILQGGSLYILSHPLARSLTAPGGRWVTRDLGSNKEDAELSKQVLHEMRQSCVDFGSPIRNAWLHFGHCGPTGEDRPNHCSTFADKEHRAMFNYSLLKENLGPDPPESFDVGMG